MPTSQRRPPGDALRRNPGTARRAAALAAVVGCALLLAAAAEARNPRLEQLVPNPADQARAAAAILTPGDLGQGWASVPDPLASQSPPGCPGVHPDLSRFTVTGTAESILQRPREWVRSRVQIYPNQRQSLADFNQTTTAARHCNTYAITHQLHSAFPTITIKLLSRQRQLLAHLGQHALADRLLIQTTNNHHHTVLHLDAIDFISGRCTATLVYLSSNNRSTQETALAREIATKLRHPQPPSA